MRHLIRVVAVALCLVPVQLLAQATTGTLLGTVTTEGRALPGVTVTITSPSLQGSRSNVTGDSGGFHFPALPPGSYTVQYELAGMQQVEKPVTVSLAQTSRADVEMRVVSMAEAITVTAGAPPVVESTEVAANFEVETIRELPTGRDIKETVYLAPGITEAAPNDQITISGAFSYDNLFLVNGVIVNENLRGQPHDLFIEDAIQETTILTGGISAEFGRFTGGVVSTLTKSGGNELSGSLRDSLSNPDWTDKTDWAAQADPIDELNNSIEATLGGKLIQDRLWFFGAARHQDSEFSKQLLLTNIPYVESWQDRRWEAKLTGQIAPQHSLVGSYVVSDNDRINYDTFGSIVDMRSLVPYDRQKTLMAINYSGVITNNLLMEAQMSRMDDDFVRGSTTRDLIEGTLIMDEDTGYRMWSSSGCGEPCGVKQHDNKDLLAKASYFLSTGSLGNHSIAGGLEEFHQLRLDNNVQSGSDYWLHGHIMQDPNDPTVLYWGIDPDSDAGAYIEWDPIASPSQMSDFAVRSVFINDKWDLNEHWNFNLGVRYDDAFGENQENFKTVDADAFSPRLAAAFDPQGSGKHRFSATYGRYVSKVDQGAGDLTTQGGRYSYYLFNYQGPAINPIGTPVNQMVPIPEVIRRVFEWFNSVGGTDNDDLIDFVSLQGYSERYDGSVQMPWMEEITLGYAMTLGNKGYLRADLIDRNWGDFYVIRRTLETGTTANPRGTVIDQGVIENSDDGLSREYQAVQLQGTYRFSPRINLGGNYTWSELRGNVVGEAAAGATTIISHPNKPEYTGFAENNREGYLPSDMRHRANLWLQFDLPTPIGDFNLSLLERYHSALSYSALGTIDVRLNATALPNGVRNPGYRSVPSNVNYYFSERGAFRVDDITSTDLGLNYSGPLGPVRIFVEADLLNILNEQGIEDPDFISTNSSVQTHRSSSCRQTANNQPCLRFNPLAGEQPVEGVHWRRTASFGQPTSVDAYQLPRTYRLSLGVRF